MHLKIVLSSSFRSSQCTFSKMFTRIPDAFLLCLILDSWCCPWVHMWKNVETSRHAWNAKLLLRPMFHPTFFTVFFLGSYIFLSSFPHSCNTPHVFPRSNDYVSSAYKRTSKIIVIYATIFSVLESKGMISFNLVTSISRICPPNFNMSFISV
jgi:hypothetical protein